MPGEAKKTDLLCRFSGLFYLRLVEVVRSRVGN